MVKTAKDDFVDRLMYTLQAPIIVYPGYEDTVLPEQRDRVNFERLAMLATAKDMIECTDYEAALYLSTASQIAPMSHTWVKIYTSVFLKAFPQSKELLDEEAQTQKLYEYEQYELTRFKQWIFKQQMQALKAKEKAAEPQKVVVQKPEYYDLTQFIKAK